MTREDLVHYYRWALARQSGMGPQWAICVTLLAFVVGAIGIAQGLSNSYFIVFCALFGWAVQTAWVRSTIRLTRVVNKQATNNPSLCVPCKVLLDSKRFCAHSSYEDIRVRWQAVANVTHDAAYIFITVGGLVYVIAHRHFPSKADAEQFLSQAKFYWQAAKQRPLQDENVWPPAPHVPG